MYTNCIARPAACPNPMLCSKVGESLRDFDNVLADLADNAGQCGDVVGVGIKGRDGERGG